MSNSVNNKRIAKNTLMLYIRMLLSIVVSLYTSRVVLEVLGIEDYGIYGVVGGVVAMFSFLNASMAGATSRFLTFEMGRGDKQRLQDTFSSAMIIHMGIALVVLILAETVGLWFLCNKLVIPEGRMEAAHWVYQCSVISVMLAITQTPYNATIIAHEKMDVYAYIEILNVTLKLLIVYLLTICEFDKLKIYAVLVLSVSVIVMMIYRTYCMHNFVESRFRLIWKSEILKPILSFTGWDLFGHFAFTARQQGSNFLINMFFGVALNAATNIAFTIQGILLQFSSNIVTAFRPAIIKEYACKRFYELNSLLNRATKMAMVLLMLLSVAIFVRIDYVLSLWLGQIPEGTIVLSRIMVIMNIFASFGSIIMIGIHATGNVTRCSVVNGVGYILTIPIMYIVLKLGLGYSICYIVFIWGTILYCLTNLYFLKKQIPQVELRYYIVRTLLPLFLVFVISIFATYYITKYLPNDVWGFFLCVIISSTIVIIASFIVVFSSKERIYIFIHLKSKLIPNK